MNTSSRSPEEKEAAKPSHSDEKNKRLSEALRKNLMRRKAVAVKRDDA